MNLIQSWNCTRTVQETSPTFDQIGTVGLDVKFIDNTLNLVSFTFNNITCIIIYFFSFLPLNNILFFQ